MESIHPPHISPAVLRIQGEYYGRVGSSTPSQGLYIAIAGLATWEQPGAQPLMKGGPLSNDEKGGQSSVTPLERGLLIARQSLRASASTPFGLVVSPPIIDGSAQPYKPVHRSPINA